MSSGYRFSDYLHFGQMLWRHRARQSRWRREYETAVAGGSFRLPFASNVTLIPTETCNLRCPMCNQWGEEGYFLRGAREAQHMEEAGLCRLVQGLDPSTTLLPGLGTRHAAAASITKTTRAVAVVVSQSSIVRVYAQGEIRAEIVPELFLLSRDRLFTEGDVRQVPEAGITYALADG